MAGVRYADAQGYENHWSQAPTEEEEKAAKLKRDLAKAKKQAEKKAAGDKPLWVQGLEKQKVTPPPPPPPKRFEA